MKDSHRILAETSATGEPLFSLRARDLHAVPTLKFYRDEYLRQPVMDTDFISDLENLLDTFERWQNANLAQLKYPD